jgi:hypothetical protein
MSRKKLDILWIIKDPKIPLYLKDKTPIHEDFSKTQSLETATGDCGLVLN